MPGLPKSYIKKYGVSKKAWRMYKASKKRPRKTRASKKRSVRRTARRYSRRKVRRRSNKWGVVGSVLKLAVGAYVGNMAGAQIAKFTGQQTPLFRAGGSLVGAIAAKKLLGKMDRTVATGAAAILAGAAAADFMTYMKNR